MSNADNSNVTSVPSGTPTVGETYFGRVKWFNGTKGYGFITVLDTNSDLFVHHSEINTSVSCWKTLYTGEYVQVEVGMDNAGKTCARSVTGIQGGQLLCENPTLPFSRRNRNNRTNDTREEPVEHEQKSWADQVEESAA
jgi:cold shock protein